MVSPEAESQTRALADSGSLSRWKSAFCPFTETVCVDYLQIDDHSITSRTPANCCGVQRLCGKRQNLPHNAAKEINNSQMNRKADNPYNCRQDFASSQYLNPFRVALHQPALRGKKEDEKPVPPKQQHHVGQRITQDKVIDGFYENFQCSGYLLVHIKFPLRCPARSSKGCLCRCHRGQR